ncbi:hypothetical protein AKJ56_00060 [candidate division MSBL1 archaeon SCGC-AAA382N08]|uniref:Uncharacterized protein n=1 Tax=candidate division MSBL1 archaeon SCGC-AAA382N08 TaxID=1698285 RepID=A0A133VQZ3_9EURY|nr:hypothetical protein AKJ56_00060 [candidate division MSBL1 archaeon SCGC-AAA382N08]
MNKLAQTITGWLLLIAGLIIIGMALYSSFNVLTGQRNPPQVFETPRQTSLERTSQVPSEAKQLIQQRLKQMMPLQNITHLINLVSWSC